MMTVNKEEAMKMMHDTGDNMLVKQNAVVVGANNNTMQSNREGLSISNNLQRSMNFASRRRQSKELRSNSAKWNHHNACGEPSSAAGNNSNNKVVGSYTGTTISHKSPPA